MREENHYKVGNCCENGHSQVQGKPVSAYVIVVEHDQDDLWLVPSIYDANQQRFVTLQVDSRDPRIHNAILRLRNADKREADQSDPVIGAKNAHQNCNQGHCAKVESGSLATEPIRHFGEQKSKEPTHEEVHCVDSVDRCATPAHEVHLLLPVLDVLGIIGVLSVVKIAVALVPTNFSCRARLQRRVPPRTLVILFHC